MDDEFNEFWMYRNRKNAKRVYKFLHPYSDVVKAPSSNITKFLITLGGRIQARKSSSIDVEDVFGFPSISESMAGSNKSIRELIRKRLEEVERGKEEEGDARRSSVQSSTLSDESEDSECARETSPGEIKLGYYNIPLRKESYDDEDESKHKRKDSVTSSIYRKDSDFTMYRKDSGRSTIRRDSGHPWMERRDSDQPRMGRRDSPYPRERRDSEDSEQAMDESPPPRRGSSSSPKDSQSPSPRSSLKRDSKRTSWDSRKSSLLKDMPWLDIFDPIDVSADNPAYPIRFLDSNDHAIFRPIKQKKLVRNKVVEEDTVFLKEHKFQTKIEMLKHDRYDHIFYGTMDSEEEEESCGSDRLPFVEEPRPPSESSDEDHRSSNREYYEKYKPIHLGKSVYLEEKIFDRLQEIKKVENRKLLYGEKEKPPYCKYDARNMVEEEKKKLRQKVQKDRQEIPLTLRQMHDKEYKYVAEVTCAGGSDRGRVDEEELFRLMELKFGRTKGDGRGRKKGREPKAMRKTFKKLKKVFRQEYGKRKLKPRKISKKKAKEIQDKERLKNLTNKLSDQLYKKIFNKKFDQLLAEAAQKRAGGVQSPRRSTLGSIKFNHEPKAEPEKKPIFKPRRLIATRDFTEVPPKIIKALDKNGILFEENLYDKLDHPLYKTVKVVKKPSLPKPPPVPVLKTPKKRRTKAKGKIPAKTKDGVPAATGRKAGVRQHKDSLKKAKHAKKTPKKSAKSVSHAVIKEEKEIEIKEEKPEPEIRIRTTIIESESLIDLDKSEDDMGDSDKRQESPRASPLPAQPRKHSLKISPDRPSPDSIKRSPEKRVSINPHAYSPSDDKVHIPKDGMRSIFSYSGPPRSSKVDKSLIQEVRSRHSLRRKSSSRSPRRRRITIEFDPEAIGTITESMKRFASFYNVPVSQLTKLAEGKIVIEPEEKKSRSQRKRKSSPLKYKTEEEETTNEVRTPSPNMEGEPSKLSPRRTIS